LGGLFFGRVSGGVFGVSGGVGGVIGGVIGLFLELITGLTEGRWRSLSGESGSLNCIALVETLSWNWKQFWEKTISGSINMRFASLFIGLGGGVGVGGKYGLIYGPIVALTFAVTSGLSTGLIGGFIRQLKVGKAFPNQGIKLSAKNSLAVFLVVLPIGGLCAGLANVLIFWPQGGLIYGLTVGLFVGVGAGLLGGLGGGLHFGGSAVIKHYALRLTLWLNDYTPFKFIKFLDHCARLILLKKVGGGYIFIHRMLLEFFAELNPSLRKLRIRAKGVREGLG